ncbi:hypothetical protein [Shimazuella kribbensis]|uniref:hypothetical protein n=1 Tax=Shimazuella kribbensis TaxID=139808 RepID=UPI0012EB59EF|nr:hypothetical protein [Shimazuella kribbensis]
MNCTGTNADVYVDGNPYIPADCIAEINDRVSTYGIVGIVLILLLAGLAAWVISKRRQDKTSIDYLWKRTISGEKGSFLWEINSHRNRIKDLEKGIDDHDKRLFTREVWSTLNFREIAYLQVLVHRLMGRVDTHFGYLPMLLVKTEYQKNQKTANDKATGHGVDTSETEASADETC